MVGMEDGLFPHQRSLNDIDGLEEERRLAYVGTTRAMRHLYITYAEQRRMHGIDSYGQASRFIQEIPEELVEEVRPRIQMQRAAYAGGGHSNGQTGGYGGGHGGRYAGGSGGRTGAATSGGTRMGTTPREEAAPGIKLGARVKHAKFGDGIVLNIEGQGPHARIQVNFEARGTKWLMLAFANLTVR
jgi:DNA helicase-2/ATP-dependent DNA helicase PcrA